MNQDMRDISDNDLHAYIDGELDGARASAVAARLAADPALAARADAFRADRDRLKTLFAPIADRPLPPQWLAQARAHRPAAPWRRMGAIAAMVLVAMAGALAWHQLHTAPSADIVTAALAARTNGGGAIAVAAMDEAHRYDARLSAVVAAPIKVPDMRRMGYRLAAIRFDAERAAELSYRDAAGRLFTLYVRRSDGAVRFDQFARGDLRVCVWQDDKVGMVMSGDVSTAAMQRLASLAYTGLNT